MKALWILYLEARGIDTIKLDLDDDEETRHKTDYSDQERPRNAMTELNRSPSSSSDWPVTQLPSSNVKRAAEFTADCDPEYESDSGDRSELGNVLSSDEEENDLGGRLANLALSATRQTETGSEFVGLKLTESVALCYIACRILKVPIFLCDFYQLARDCEFPYMRAAGGIPYSIRIHLESRYLRIFEPTSYPLPGVFHTFCGYSSGILYLRDELEVPSIPIDGILLTRFVHDLLLPLEIYQAVTHLSKILHLKFDFQRSIKTARGESHPEIKLMALVIIATKLCFGMDGTLRAPSSITEQAAQQIDWNLWKSAILSTQIITDWEKLDDVTVSNSRMGNISERMANPISMNTDNSTHYKAQSLPGSYDYDYNDPSLWDYEHINRFLDFYERTWIIGDEEEAKELLRKCDILLVIETVWF